MLRMAHRCNLEVTEPCTSTSCAIAPGGRAASLRGRLQLPHGHQPQHVGLQQLVDAVKLRRHELAPLLEAGIHIQLVAGQLGKPQSQPLTLHPIQPQPIHLLLATAHVPALYETRGRDGHLIQLVLHELRSAPSLACSCSAGRL